ncbi:MAG TPA: FHA domain-containing protein [Polyangiaceae bacterium]
MERERKTQRSLDPGGPGSGGRGSGKKRFWLEHGSQNIELRIGTLSVGRSSGCNIVLDDNLVSRRHAEFLVSDTTVSVRDLGSVNGVYVNSRRINDTVSVKDGDRIQIGQHEFKLRMMVRESVPVADRLTVDTLHGGPSDPTGANDEQTHAGDVFDLLGPVADKVLALGRGDEAERILSGVLQSVLREVQGGKDLDHSMTDRAAAYAIRLAEGTGRAQWLDYVIDLFSGINRVLPAPQVDRLYDVVRKARGMNVTAFRAYVAKLQANASMLGPSERFVLQRLEGLERVLLR